MPAELVEDHLAERREALPAVLHGVRPNRAELLEKLEADVCLLGPGVHVAVVVTQRLDMPGAAEADTFDSRSVSLLSRSRSRSARIIARSVWCDGCGFLSETSCYGWG